MSKPSRSGKNAAAQRKEGLASAAKPPGKSITALAIDPHTRSRFSGAPSVYTPAKAQRVLDLIAQGVPVSTIGAMPGLPSRDTIWRWISQREDYQEAYARAKDHAMDRMAEDVLELSDLALHAKTSEEAQGRRLQVDTRKWIMSKFKPKRFGDKLTTEHTGGISIAAISAGLKEVKPVRIDKKTGKVIE